MGNEYIHEIDSDDDLNAIVGDRLTPLKHLTFTQIEKLVFYLKSLHTYYPKSENQVSFWSDYETKLREIGNSPEQVALQRKASDEMLKAMGYCVLAGILLAGAALAFFIEQKAASVGLLVISGAAILFADIRHMTQATIISKEQDRRYFLMCIRTAKACNELEWSGLFSYNKASKEGPLSNADEAKINEEISRLTSELRAALYNDEYFHYSLNEPRSNDESAA